MRLDRDARSVPPERNQRAKSRTRAAKPATPRADFAEPLELQQAVGNRAAGNLLSGLRASRHASYAPEEEKAERTPQEMANEEVKRGPKKNKPKGWEQELNQAAKKVSDSQPIQIRAVNERQGVKLVSKSMYDELARNAKKFHQEAGLARAFLDSRNSIGPYQINTEPDIDTNVLMQTRSTGKNGGEVWVQSAAIPWVVRTAGYMDESRIDPSMLPDYKRHEEGHASIAEQVRDRLLPLLQGEMNRSLPTATRPLRFNGNDWVKRGGDAIFEKIGALVERYQNLWDELSTRADKEWDRQEKQTLSRIAAAKAKEAFQPGGTVPE